MDIIYSKIREIESVERYPRIKSVGERDKPSRMSEREFEMMIDAFWYLICALMLMIMPFIGAAFYYAAFELWNKHLDRRWKDDGEGKKPLR